MKFFTTFCITFPFVWLFITFVQVDATHKPFAQCLTSMRLDCE